MQLNPKKLKKNWPLFDNVRFMPHFVPHFDNAIRATTSDIMNIYWPLAAALFVQLMLAARRLFMKGETMR